MLAYVFWHWPKADQAPADYERIQREFHAALGQSAPTGFLRSSVYRVDGGAPWLGGSPAYADWYLVADSAALDPLNVAAVTGECEAPHAAVAHAMAAGVGSLFALRGDINPDLVAAHVLTLLTKPRDMPYADFYAAVPPSSPTSSLWRRTMVLGPTPEFALLSADPTSNMEALHPLSLALTRI